MCDYKRDMISVRKVVVVLYELILNTHSCYTYKWCVFLADV